MAGKNDNAWTDQLDEIIQQFQNAVRVVEDTAEQVLLPMLESNYNASGIKTHRGVVKKSITKRFAEGNILKAEGGAPGMVHLEVGTSLLAAKYAIEGNKPKGGGDYIYPVRAKALSFTINGKRMVRKRVHTAPPHDTIYQLTGAEEELFKEKVIENLMKTDLSQRKS
jgi:hypothetical protein